MDDHVSEREVVQGDARPLDRSGAHHRDRERIVSVSKNAGEKRRQQIKLSLCSRPTLRPKRVALRAPQDFAPAGGRVMHHQRVGPKEKIKRGQIKLTEAALSNIFLGTFLPSLKGVFYSASLGVFLIGLDKHGSFVI